MGVSRLAVNGTLWNVTAFHLWASISQKGWNPGNNILGQTSANLVLGDFTKCSPSLHYKLLGHCLSVTPWGQRTGNFLPQRYLTYIKIKIIHVFTYSKATVKGLARTFYIPFRVTNITDNKQGIHFTCQIHNAGLLEKAFKEFYVLDRMQIANLIKKHIIHLL